MKKRKKGSGGQRTAGRRKGTGKRAGRSGGTEDRVVYQLKVTLMGTIPPVWRRFQVTGDTSLGKLHSTLQVVMGWDDYHLHRFVVGEREYMTLDPELMLGPEVMSERHARLEKVVPGKGFRFHYRYDFGDRWEHELRVEEILSPEPGKKYPVCLGGKRACPPEDWGGVWAYADLLEAIKHPEHPDSEVLLDMMNQDRNEDDRFDPKAFDLDEVNGGLREIGRSKYWTRSR